MTGLERLVVPRPCKYGLRMIGIDQVDGFIINRSVAHRVGAVEDDELRLRLQLRDVEDAREMRALPFADRAPPFDAIVARNLRALGHCAELCERDGKRTPDQPIDLQPPVGEL